LGLGHDTENLALYQPEPGAGLKDRGGLVEAEIIDHEVYVGSAGDGSEVFTLIVILGGSGDPVHV